MDYKIRYVQEIDANIIPNVQEPPQDRIDSMNSENNWFEKLEESIVNHGLRNPICLTAKDGILDIRYGGSRLMISQKHNLKVHAIVADFDDRFPDAETADPNDPVTFVRSKFVDQPKKVIFKPHGINISGCMDVHLK